LPIFYNLRAASSRDYPIVPFPFHPSPSTLWSLHRDGKVASCQLRFVPLGNEVRMLRNALPLVSRIFESGEEALAWAEEERERLVEGGWLRWQIARDELQLCPVSLPGLSPVCRAAHGRAAAGIEGIANGK